VLVIPGVDQNSFCVLRGTTDIRCRRKVRKTCSKKDDCLRCVVYHAPT
jgi:hypothetical protein